MALSARKFDISTAEGSLIKSIWLDDKVEFVTHSKKLYQTSLEPIDRTTAAKLLQLCCTLDSVECAMALVNGELGAIPLVNEMNETGRNALHIAADSHASRCIELLLRKRARTDLRTKDDCAQLPLELLLSSASLDVIWTPEENSIEDLVVLLNEKDLSAVRLLSEKTKELAELANGYAVHGRIVPFTALLIAAPEKVIDSVLELHDADSGSKEKVSIYECVMREALRAMSPSKATKRNCTTTTAENAERRKLLLREIEMLQLFGAEYGSTVPDKGIKSPIIRACRAGDEAIIELLLKTNINVNETDAEGNSALHWCLKTSWGSSPQQIKILHLFLNHGARVNQKNKLGLTALHFAAATGNSQALQILLLEDPDGVNYKTEMKETPLFFAVKNDYVDCAELLLQWGANSEVLNLRRQRPMDFALSQDMRFMLNPTNISLINRTSPMQREYSAWLQGNEIISETCAALLSMTDEDSRIESCCSRTKAEVCKYFESPGGCVRGTKCFYMHDEGVPRQMTQGTSLTWSPGEKIGRKIFVGGLHSSVDSDSLSKYFEEQFGSVEEAVVVGAQKANLTKSRGFGYVTFKHEKSAIVAVQAHYVNIMGKQVEIKSMAPKCFLPSELRINTPEEKRDKYEPLVEILKESVRDEQMTLVNRVIYGNESSNQAEEPEWLRTFKKWLPDFLVNQSKHLKGDYPLSSLKGDFRATFGVELDHGSLGYSKLSDFVKSFPSICRIKIVPIGKRGPATHLVLQPNPPMLFKHLHHHTLRMNYTPSNAVSVVEKNGNNSNATVCVQVLSVSCENLSPPNTCAEKNNQHNKNPDSSQHGSWPSVNSRIPQLLKLDPLFHSRPWLRNEGDAVAGDNDDQSVKVNRIKANNLRPQKRHAVLEALARRRNNLSVFFLREFNFYHKYKASMLRGMCFGCNQSKLCWANFPCRHSLWCNDCKVEAIRTAGTLQHKCVVCDMEVQRLDFLVTCDGYFQSPYQTFLNTEFPPFDPNHLRSPSKKKFH